MQRIVLCVLAACGQLDRVGDTAELVNWLERYDRVRECVVSPLGDSVAQGAAVAMLQGVECAEPIAALTARVPLDQPATVRWRRIAKSLGDPSPHVRATAVEEGDIESLVLRMSLGIPVVPHPRRALPKLEDGPVLAVDGHPVGYTGISFNGGRIRGTNWGYRFEIYSPVRGRRWILRARHMAHPSGRWSGDDVPGDSTWVTADREQTRVAVGSVIGAGYSLSVSRDNGEHWERSVIAPGMQFLEFHQDWGTGEIDVLVGNSGREVYRHAISPSDPRPKVIKLGRMERLGTVVCRHDGHAWRRAGDELVLAAPSGVATYDVRASTHSLTIDCRGDRAIVLRRSEQPDVLLRCGRKASCSEVHRSTSQIHGVAAMFDDGGWIYAASKEGVVTIWREGQREQLYRLAADYEVVAIAVLENKPYLVIDELTRFSLVAIR